LTAAAIENDKQSMRRKEPGILRAGGVRTAALALVTLLPDLTAAQTPSARLRATQLESLASRFPYFCAQSFFMAQPGCYGDHEAEYQKLVEELSSVRASRDQLVGLLSHSDPKVRTLAIVLLFTKEDPGVLPHIAAKVDDGAPTFPEVLPDARPLPFVAEHKPILESRTVGEIAERAVRLYLEPAGFFRGLRGIAGYPGFDQYWAARKHRTYCAGWFYVQLGRASGQTSPTLADRVPKIRAVRKRIDRLPEPDRTWTLLWLNGEPGSEALVSEAELLRACRKVGPELLLRMLQRRIATGDPDLQPRDNNNYTYARMTRWVLERAGQLLRKSDAEALLECERRERHSGFSDPNVTALWAIGAAQLRPDLAPKILPEALPRFEKEWQGDDRASLASAIWQHGGPKQADFLRDWFYTESPRRGHFPHSRALFLRLVTRQAGPALRLLIAGIVSDSRLESLDWQTLESLATTVNAVAKKAVVPPAELERASHPLGMAHFHWERERAAEQYPKETAELLKVLEGWRERLRASVAEWSK